MQSCGEERSSEHLGLGLHHSFLLPDPASQMLIDGGSAFCSDDKSFGTLVMAWLPHQQCSHSYEPQPPSLAMTMYMLLFVPLTRIPFLGSMKLLPDPGVKSRIGSGEDWS